MKKIYLLFVLILVLSSGHYANECSDIALANAQKQYHIGAFEDILETLLPCTRSGFSDQQKEQSYHLLSLTYLALDSVEQSREMANELILLNPQWEPDLFDPILFKRMIESIKDERNIIEVTSVSKRVENILHAPATVEVITRDEIEKRGITDLESLLSDLPGFDISRTFATTYSNIYLRGYRSNNTQKILFLIDGIEENDLWTKSPEWARQFPVSNVDRIEIVYGPASTMYGADAMIGVVNVITQDATTLTDKKSFGLRAHLGLGSFQTKFADLVIAGRKKNLSFSLTYRNFYSDEMDLSDYPEFNYDPADYYQIDYQTLLSVHSDVDDFLSRDQNDYYDLSINDSGDSIALLNESGINAARGLDQSAYAQEVNGHPIEYSNISRNHYFYGKFNIDDFQLGFEMWSREQGSNNYYHDNSRSPALNGSVWIPVQRFFYAKYNKQVSSNLSLMNLSQYKVSTISDETITTILSNYSNGSLSANDLLENTQPYWLSYYLYQISRQLRNEFKMVYNYHQKLDFIAGFEFRNSAIQGNYIRSFDPDSSVIETGLEVVEKVPGGNTYTEYDYGIYAQASYNHSRVLKATLGGRYDYNRIRVTGGYGSIFNPRIALVYLPQNYVFKFIYASAFQNASNWEKFATTGTRQLPNPNLEPERVRNFELSAGYQFSQEIHLDLAYYQAYYDGIIGTKVVPFQGGTTLQNQAIGKSKIKGFQATFLMKLNDFDCYLNYSYTDPKNNIVDDRGNLTDEYQRIGAIAAHRINVGINSLILNHINLNLRMNYASQRPVGENTTMNLNPGHFDSFLLLNGTLSYKDIFPGFTAQLIINNITDIEYFDPGVRTADGLKYAYRIPQRRRNYIFQLIYKFN